MTRSRVLVGVGSPFGADTLGWRVVEALRPELESAGYRVLVLDRPGPALLEHLANVDEAVIVDAVMATGNEVLALGLEDLERAPSSSTHGFGLAHALALGKALSELPACLAVYGLPLDMPLEVAREQLTAWVLGNGNMEGR